MGKLTDSLKATSNQLDRLKSGIQQMQGLGEALADNTEVVAEAALRAGYAYAKVEAARTDVAQAQLSLQSDTQFTDAQFTHVQAEASAPAPCPPSPWTLKMLKAEFGKAAEAYAHLKREFGVSLRSRSWQNILDALNKASNDAAQPKTPVQLPAQGSSLGLLPGLSLEPSALAARILALEQLVDQQSARIAQLEDQVGALLRSPRP
jgi:hypothetical protein